jgi:hypothetical protein
VLKPPTVKISLLERYQLERQGAKDQVQHSQQQITSHVGDGAIASDAGSSNFEGSFGGPANARKVSTLNYPKAIAKAAKQNFFNKSDNVKQAVQDGTRERESAGDNDRYDRKTFNTIRSGTETGGSVGNLAAAYPEIRSRKEGRKNQTSSNTHLVLGPGGSPQKLSNRRGINQEQRNRMVVSSVAQQLQYSEQEQSMNLKQQTTHRQGTALHNGLRTTKK